MKKIYATLILSLLVCVSYAQQKITGTVTDESTGEPLIGALVSVKGTSQGQLTDVNGKYTLTNVATGKTISVTYLGMIPQEFVVAADTKELNVNMKPDALGANEVVVVGFSTQKKVNLTGAVSVVQAKELENRPVNNLGQALQGLVPGLNLSVNSGGGELNNTLNMNIRGGGTIGTGSGGGVLVLIDGMEGNMNTLNPQDVESITVLKDAAASSIYGSRAPFGVLLITTKRGKSGKVAVNYNNNFRWTDPLLTPNMMNSEEFGEYLNLGSKNAGGGKIFGDALMQKIRDHRSGKLLTETGPNANGDSWDDYSSWADNDWFDIQYKDWVFSHEHNLSITGGSDKVQYYISGNFMDQNGLLRFSKDTFTRYSFNAKITAQLAKWASVTSNTRFVENDYDRASYQTGLFYHNIARRWPNVPYIYPEVEGSPFNQTNYGNCNEIEQLRSGGRDKNQKAEFYQQLQLILEPIQGWRIVAEGNFRQTSNFNQWEILPMYWQRPNGVIEYVDFDGGDTAYTPGQTRVGSSANKENYFNSNIYTEYAKEWESGHNFKVMVGFQSEITKNRNISATGDQLITSLLPTLDNTTITPKVGGSFWDWATTGFFGRVNYTYKDRYLLEVNARYDGTSRFLRDKRWNVFPSVSIGWNLAKEAFMEKSSNWLNMLKVRGSWGQLGNQNTNNKYPFYQSMPIGKDYSWLINGKKPSLYANAPGLVSSLMTWETVEQWNVGLDFGFFDSRLTGSFDYYERMTKDMIGPAPTLPGVLGVSVPQVNNADLKNYGFEFQIGWRDIIKSAGITYGISFTLSDNQKKITRYPNPTASIGDWYAGQMDGQIWGYTTIGIAQSQAEMDAHLAKVDQSSLGTNWKAGDIMYADLDNNGKLDQGKNQVGDTGDRRIIGNNTARFTYGINGDIAWKGIDFSFFIQGVGKRDVSVGGPYFWGMAGDEWQTAGFKEHMDFWRPAETPATDFYGPNTGAYYPRAEFNSGRNQQRQTKYMQNGAYLRLKNIQLGYTLPQKITQKFACQRLRFFVSADNLATWTNLAKMFDPETIDGAWGEGKVYPLSKVISGGLSITF